MDWDKTFRDIFPDPRDLRRQLVDIATNVYERTSRSEDCPKFLTVKKYFCSPRCAATSEPCRKQTCGRCSNELNNFSYAHAETTWLTLSLVQPLRTENPKYLAISYCWTESDKFKSTGESDPISEGCCTKPVMIEQLDGSIRKSRAPSRILRRAIRHAAANNLKYIWIDQECIEQQDSAEKKCAIEAMDQIYQQAHIVLSLLDARLEDDLASAARKALERPPPSIDGTNLVFQWVYRSNIQDFIEAADALCSILEFVASDRWFTRAWILQERLCSSLISGSDELWLMCAPTLRTAIRGSFASMPRTSTWSFQCCWKLWESKIST